jgi:hypothetical protein
MANGKDNNNKGDGEVAEVINAVAGGVDSVGGIINTFTGGASSSSNAAPPPAAPIEENKPNWVLIGGVGIGIVGLIAFLIYINKKENGSKGQANKG